MGKRLAFLIAASLAFVACGTSQLVTIERSDQIRSAPADDDPFDQGSSTSDPEPDAPDPSPAPGPSTSEPSTSDPADPPTTDPTVPHDPPTTDPDDADDPGTQPDEPVVLDPNTIDFGENKPPRDYDDFLLAALADIEVWLTEEYPDAFGAPWEPLEGKVFAGYPERTSPLPGCGEPETSYQDLQLFVAFYCPIGDFIIYDDGDEPVTLPTGDTVEPILFSLAEQFGPATIGIVLAHEYGHAVQRRSGALDLNLPTVSTEQQADCIAGAWAGRAAAGDATGVPFDDEDVRAGLISMITVQDPVGIDPTTPGGHGSGFDRVGAFQVGFQQGLARCAELIDDPLPLTPLQFLGPDDFRNEGNAPFGFAENELFGFLVPDLNAYYDLDLDLDFDDFVPLELVAVQRESEIGCADPIGDFDSGAALCYQDRTVYLNEPGSRSLYGEFGDFSVGYILGVSWADAALTSMASEELGESRALLNDCLTGAWVSTLIPDENFNLPEPRSEERTAVVSPGDLTEAIQTAILVGDPKTDTNLIGSAFEKIDAFRTGALGGMDACTS